MPKAVPDSPFSTPFKFTAAYRLLRADRFDHVIRAENIADKYFKIFFVSNYHNNARLGIIASKKMLSRAADRNRIKRAIRETFRQHNIKFSKLDVVVIVKRGQKINEQIENLEKLFSQVENRCAE
ncbi:MAG: ribonuclease P protein component [Gallionella sp.]